jgi:hypothetical protein
MGCSSAGAAILQGLLHHLRHSLRLRLRLRGDVTVLLACPPVHHVLHTGEELQWCPELGVSWACLDD